MALSYAPDPDLFIRTGGEVRISNFLLWQAAYSELYFTDCLWPEFGDAELDAALADYARRERRFGDVPSDAAAARRGGRRLTRCSSSASSPPSSCSPCCCRRCGRRRLAVRGADAGR